MLNHRNRITMIMAAGGAALLLVGMPTHEARGAVLWNDEQLTIITDLGTESVTLYDRSSVNVPNGGAVWFMYAYNTSTVDVLGGPPPAGSYIDIGGGQITSFQGYDDSTVNVAAGYVNSLTVYGGKANISGGQISTLSARQDGSVDITGGYAETLQTANTATAHISGGTMRYLSAQTTSTVVFDAWDFRLGSGLSLSGNVVLGRGILSGEWSDGTRWTVSILTHDAGATILAVPEPGMLASVGIPMAGLLLRRRSSRRAE